MDLYTLNRNVLYIPGRPDPIIVFTKRDIVEGYESFIWTERYAGNGDLQITAGISQDILNTLPQGIWLGLDGSKDIMSIETININESKLTFNGISVLPWLNNRFIRNSKAHKVRQWDFEDEFPSDIIWTLMSNAINFSGFDMLESNTDIPEEFLALLRIPEIGLHSLDYSDKKTTLSIDFGDLYSAISQIASDHTMGMSLHLQDDPDLDYLSTPGTDYYALGFRTYKGLNRTHTQDPTKPQNGIVTFSKGEDSLSNIQEIHSISNYKTLCFAFAPNLDTDLGLEFGDHNAGISWVRGMGLDNPEAGGLNCRALQFFSDDMQGYPHPLDNATIIKILTQLNKEAGLALKASSQVSAVDGEIVSNGKYVYGVDYYLGDLIEIEGESGITSIGMVQEYIRAKGAGSDVGYPTVTLLDALSSVEATDTYIPGPNDAHDNVGSALLIPPSVPDVGWNNDFKGRIKGINIDCTSDKPYGWYDGDGNGNTDWLVRTARGNQNTDDNWKTIWYKFPIHIGSWATGSKLKITLTDYSAHAVLFACVPRTGAIPPNGNAPSEAHRDKYDAVGVGTRPSGFVGPLPPGITYASVTEQSDNSTVDPISILISKSDLTDLTNNEDWIYIGVGSQPRNFYNEVFKKYGGDFILHWAFTH